jgi:hypothetical protein
MEADSSDSISAELQLKAVAEHALEHGLLPVQLTGDRRRPFILNQKAWRLPAVLRAEGWTEQTQVNETTFLAALDKLDAGTIR